MHSFFTNIKFTVPLAGFLVAVCAVAYGSALPQQPVSHSLGNSTINQLQGQKSSLDKQLSAKTARPSPLVIPSTTTTTSNSLALGETRSSAPIVSNPSFANSGTRTPAVLPSSLPTIKTTTPTTLSQPVATTTTPTTTPLPPTTTTAPRNGDDGSGDGSGGHGGEDN